MNLRDIVILSRSGAEAKNLMPRQTGDEILRRCAPQNDTPQNHSDAVLGLRHTYFTGFSFAPC